jgi:Fe(3+) dicitrate transport protein
MKKNILFGLAISASISTFSQQSQEQAVNPDTVSHYRYLKEITIVGRGARSDYQQMPEIVGTNIYAGKKNALIVLDNVQGNVVTNTMRQVVAKVPGIHIWESDPSGIQIGIAARGLSPNRSWEFNVRQNGYDIAADPFGYPEAYYNPQLQAVQRIEIVRGAGSLQYGPQFGGLVNYILRNGSDIDKKFEFETQQTVGSYGLFNSYNAIGGKTEKVHYYSFFDHRNGNGFRDNSRYYTNAGFVTATFKMNEKFSLTTEVMHSHIRSQQPGGLTDAQMNDDIKESFRSRNWFDIKWTTPAIIADYQFNENTRWNTKLFATIGDRGSVGFLQSITLPDSINPATGEYNNRDVLLDTYRNYGLESRMITNYNLGSATHTFTGGIRLYTGTTHRRSSNKGTTGTGYDMAIEGNYLRDIDFDSKNVAAYVENVFRITDKMLLIPGLRYEWLEGSATGLNNTVNGVPQYLQNVTRSRGFFLAGIGAEYHVAKKTEIYANYSQAYRPIQFANLQAPPTTDVIDNNLKDSKGYNMDLGYRGKLFNYLQFDVSVYRLKYNNRVGTVSITTNDSVPSSYRYVTNVGGSVSKGVEAYVEFNPIKARNIQSTADLIIFGSYSYTDARYSNDHKDGGVKGKKVENAPANIFRGGISGGYKTAMLTAQLSYVDRTFSDANNTVEPTANGNTGLIPSYTIVDLTGSYKITKAINFKVGVNNLTDKKYFTRRAGGYPGPGVLPADGRTFFVSAGARL